MFTLGASIALILWASCCVCDLNHSDSQWVLGADTSLRLRLSASNLSTPPDGAINPSNIAWLDT